MLENLDLRVSRDPKDPRQVYHLQCTASVEKLVHREREVQLEIVGLQVPRDRRGLAMQRENQELMGIVVPMVIQELLANKDHRCALQWT